MKELLELGWDAEGKGLHEKLDAVQALGYALPKALVRMSNGESSV
jgi:hypothetical protein